jgi:ABC-type dipeptide/oligopeptide/nickel transport system permease component
LPIAAVFTRLLRADMIIALQSDFVTLARAKGMSPNASSGATRCDRRCSPS